MQRILGMLIALVFFVVGHTSSAQDSELFQRAQTGDSDAQVAVGNQYFQGNGVQKNEINAEIWYRKAAENGNAEAQMALGKLYHRGIVVNQSYATAVQWWKKAAAQGNEQAPAFLAAAYLTGGGVPQSYSFAHMWFSVLSAGSYRSEYGSNAKDSIEVLMTPEEIADAKTMLIEFMDKQCRDC